MGDLVCPLSTRDIVDRIVLFCEGLSDVKFYTYQSLFARRIVESVLENDGADITGLWARQCGKTETVADVGIGLAVILPVLAREFPDDKRFMPFAKGFWAGIYAPVQDQAQIAFTRMREKVNSPEGKAILEDEEIGVEVLTNRGDVLTFSNGSIIIAKTASPDTQIEGKTHHLVFLEEAQKLSRTKVEKEILPMLAFTNGSMVKIGTAWESRGGFHVSIQQNIDTYQAGGKRNHFEFPVDIVISEKRRMFELSGNPKHLNYEKFVDKELAKMGGRETDEFKMNFRCMWKESRVIAVSEHVFAEAADMSLEAGPRRYGVQVGGLDIGKIHDVTVLTSMLIHLDRPIRNYATIGDVNEDKQKYYPKTIVDWLELGGSFEGSNGQYNRLVEYLLQTSIQVLVIDCTAMGDPVFERIEYMIGGSIVCVPYRFTSLSKSLLYKYYLQELNSGRVRYAAGGATMTRPEWIKFRGEHLDLDKEEFGGYTLCRAPEGGHDDYPDSAALACWGEKVLEDVRMPEIEISSASDYGGGASRRREAPMAETELGGGRGTILEMMAKASGERASRYARGRR